MISERKAQEEGTLPDCVVVSQPSGDNFRKCPVVVLWNQTAADAFQKQTGIAYSLKNRRHRSLLKGHAMFSRGVVFASVLVWLGGVLVTSAPAASRPNVLLIVVDDLGYGELGCQGNPQIPTPAIDSLAKNGIRFTSGYVTASYCSPSRAGLMTGRYQTRFGHELNPVGRFNLDPKAGLPTTERTLAEQLKSAGYRTALIGKWHLGGTEAYHPLNRGFDEFYGFLHEGHFYVPPPYDGVLSFLRKKTLPAEAKMKTHWREGNIIYTSHMGTNEPPYDAHNPVLRGREPLVEPTYLTDAFTREAVRFLEQPREQPFFLYLAYNAVHSPLQARMDDLKPFENLDAHRRVFAGILSNLDRNVGKILKTLKQKSLEENTLIFLIATTAADQRINSSNRPLRGGKGNLYEGGIREKRWSR